MIDVKGFKKKLIDDDLTIKQWAIDNGMDADRLKNIFYGIVKATDEEIAKIKMYVES